jgi:hypothetical protein
MHEKILCKPTFRQSRVAISATEANIDHNQVNKDDTPILESEESKKNIQQKPNTYNDKLVIHYTHEK